MSEPPAMPSVVRIGIHDYAVSHDDVVLADDNLNMLGMCLGDSLSIFVKGEMPLSKEQEVLLHETLHGVVDQAGLDFDHRASVCEAFVNRMTPLLLDTLRRNPALLEYLLWRPS